MDTSIMNRERREMYLISIRVNTAGYSYISLC